VRSELKVIKNKPPSAHLGRDKETKLCLGLWHLRSVISRYSS